MNVETAFDLKDKLLEDFKKFDEQLNGQSTSVFHGKRKSASEEFKLLSFPTKKHEEWKYTNIKAITEKNFDQNTSDLLSNSLSNSLNEKIDLAAYLPEGLDADVLVFINGEWSSSHSNVSHADGITVKSLAVAIAEDTDLINEHFGKYAKYNDNTFAAMNSSFAKDGLFLHVAKSQAIAKPILCLYLNDTSKGNQLSINRNLILVDENAQVQIIEGHYNLNDDNFSLTNNLTEVLVGKNAKIDHYKLQLENDKAYQYNFCQFVQQQSSTVHTNTVTLSGELVRNDLHFLLEGEHCDSFLNGIYLSDGTQLFDNHSLVDHAVPNCMSDEFYKGIMGGSSKGVFNGKILVREDAQKTNAFQSNKNVLVSDNASINTKPQLEIFADDVRCTHGATTGQMDDEALFYMQARGIGKETARKILLRSFIGEVMERMNSKPIVDYVNELIEAKIETL